MLKSIFLLYSNKKWERPLLNNLEFRNIGVDQAQWLERNFEEEVCEVVFEVSGDKAPSPNCFPMAFCQKFWNETKDEILAFLKER